MDICINAGFGEPISHEFFGLSTYGFTRVRQDLYAHGISQVPTLIAEFVEAPVKPLFLIGGGHIQHPNGGRLEPHELALWTAEVVDMARDLGLTNYLIEIGNEPDLAHPDYANYPEDFAEAVLQCYNAACAGGFRGSLISGGISNLNERGFSYLARMLNTNRIPPDAIIGFHRYPESGRLHLAPHQGYHSREDEWEMLMDLTKGYTVACTEFGYSTFTEERGHTRTDQEVAVSIPWDLNFYAHRSTSLAAVYQLNDGPEDNVEGRYGIRTFEGTWKPVAEAIRETYGE